MKSIEAWDVFMKSKVYSPQTLRKYQTWKIHWSNHFPEMPVSAFEINEYLLSLRVKDITLKKRRDVFKAMYTYLEVQLDFPNPFKKVMNPKVKKEPRRYFNTEELFKIINSAHPGLERILILLLIDSPCRIGELGQHLESNDIIYPGLRTDMLYNNTMNVRGKTGVRSYRLDPDIHEALIQLSAPNGQCFTSVLHPEGMTTKALIETVRRIIERAGIEGKKLGPHTLRHSSASLVSQKSNGNLLLIKALLQDTESKNAQIYIHDIEDNLKQSVSPLKMLNADIAKSRPQQPIQPLMLTDGTPSTELSIVESPIETIDATPDLSDELFPKIADNLKTINPHLHAKDLQYMTEAFVFFARNNPFSNTTGHLTQMMKRILRNAKISDI